MCYVEVCLHLCLKHSSTFLHTSLHCFYAKKKIIFYTYTNSYEMESRVLYCKGQNFGQFKPKIWFRWFWHYWFYLALHCVFLKIEKYHKTFYISKMKAHFEKEPHFENESIFLEKWKAINPFLKKLQLANSLK